MTRKLPEILQQMLTFNHRVMQNGQTEGITGGQHYTNCTHLLWEKIEQSHAYAKKPSGSY